MAIELKLKYCPECGSFVTLHYGQGLLYQAISWRCTNKRCHMSKESKPLVGWNEANRPNLKTRLLRIIRDIKWKIRTHYAKNIITS